jgi:hypothetical protein
MQQEKRRDEEIMNDDINNQIIIYCPNCKPSITIDALGEHVNANPDIKKQALEEELEL